MSTASARRFDIDEPEETPSVRGLSMTERQLHFDVLPAAHPVARLGSGGLMFYGGGTYRWPGHGALLVATQIFPSSLAWQSELRFFDPIHSFDLDAVAVTMTGLDEDIPRLRGFVETAAPTRLLASRKLEIQVGTLRRWLPAVILDRRTIDAAE